jgi:hypothetical protein
MEIICISCWRAFEHDTTTAAEQVTCPHCSFEQPGPDPKSLDAKLDANTRPSDVQAKETPTTPEQPVAPPAASVLETADYEAALNIPPVAPQPPPAAPQPAPAAPQPAPAAPQPAPAAPQPAQPDRRWRLRTPTAMVLFFADYEGLSRYLTGDEDGGYGIACGPGPFRQLTGFTAAMRVTDDPLEALVNVPPADGEVDEMSVIPASPRPRSGARRATTSSSSGEPRLETPGTRADTDERPAGNRARSRRRRATATADFTFRKAQAQNVWPGRLLFLMIGLLAGGAAMYYVAWIGLLPGIVY